MEANIKVEVRAIAREVKSGNEKGKKFLAYQIFNKKKGVYEELRFNRTVKNIPTADGVYILEVPTNEINRLYNNRKYPLTWISEVISIEEYVTERKDVPEDEVLPF